MKRGLRSRLCESILTLKNNNKGGESLQNVLWILIGLAIALLVGVLFFDEQIVTLAQNIWGNLIQFVYKELNEP